MNTEKLQETLLRAARQNPPSDAVPYAFEKRIMARLKVSPVADAWTLWGRSLWRAAISCAAVAVVCGAWAFSGSTASVSASSGDDLSAQLEDTFYASAAANLEESW